MITACGDKIRRKMSQLLEEEEASLWYVCKICRRVFPKKRLLLVHRKIDHLPQQSVHHQNDEEKVVVVVTEESMRSQKDGGENFVLGKRKFVTIPNSIGGGGGGGVPEKWAKDKNNGANSSYSTSANDVDECDSKTFKFSAKVSKIIVIDSTPSNKETTNTINESNLNEANHQFPRIFRNATEALRELRQLPQKFRIVPPSPTMAEKPVKNQIQFFENLPLTRQQVERAFRDTVVNNYFVPPISNSEPSAKNESVNFSPAKLVTATEKNLKATRHHPTPSSKSSANGDEIRRPTTNEVQGGKAKALCSSAQKIHCVNSRAEEHSVIGPPWTSNDKFIDNFGGKNVCKNCGMNFDNLFSQISQTMRCTKSSFMANELARFSKKKGAVKGCTVNRLQSSRGSSSSSSSNFSSKSGSSGEKILDEKSKRCAYWAKLVSQKNRRCCSSTVHHHSEEVKEKPFRCKFCARSFSNFDLWRQHETKYHRKKLILHSTNKHFTMMTRTTDLKKDGGDLGKVNMKKEHDPTNKVFRKMMMGRGKEILEQNFTKKPFDGGMVHVCKFCCKVFHDQNLALDHHAQIHEDEDNQQRLKRPDSLKMKRGWEATRLPKLVQLKGDTVGEDDRNSDSDSERDGDGELGSEVTTAYFEEEYQNTVYCVCSGFAYGDMIACENEKCAMEWFHFDCVGLRAKPKGHWYCPDCEPKLGDFLETD